MNVRSSFTIYNYFTASFSSFPALNIGALAAKKLVGIII
ncbi:hypothetical protein BCG9842_B2015 [Bacillus cereus G9842]|uniref:Uncharacterized protein n=1 Tax=Bacillus cereus (strain G9842) TaxID=405531 RepID=B7INJ0_BACC2|nr:hypothetical protein BCG9842_B2015 [Bacillus cereus G9842]